MDLKKSYITPDVQVIQCISTDRIAFIDDEEDEDFATLSSLM